ncbi:HEAT repeat domain-containing protein [Chloroflexi bacterium TSY]|nr:HEAT repeat domain-containing protein [Chloroflexi bacterium TSY]
MTEPKTLGPQQIADLKQSLADVDLSIRFNAALDLAKVGDTDSIPVLIEGFQANSFATRLFHAGQALISLGEAAIPALTDALASEHETVRVDAAYVLWKVDPTRTSEILSVVIDVLRNWNPNLNQEPLMHTVLIDVAVLLAEMGTTARPAIPALADLLRRPVHQDDPLAWQDDPRILFAMLMNQITDSPSEVVPVLIDALASKEDSLRWAAARALGEFREAASAAIPSFISIFADEQEKEAIRVEAAYSLAIVGDPIQETLSAFKKALTSQDWWVRASIARILGEMGSPEAKKQQTNEGQFILNQIFLSYQDVRRIAQPEEHIVPLLTKALTDDDYNVRRNAVYALSLIGERATDAIPLLIAAMRSPDIGPLAAEAMAKMGRSVIPALMQTWNDSDDPLLKHAIYALQLLNAPDVKDAASTKRHK